MRLLVVLACVLASGVTGLDLFHSGKEYEYEFETDTYVGPNEEHLHDESGFTYAGKLYVQHDSENMLRLKMKIEDIHIANGESTSDTHEHDHKGHKLEISYDDKHYHVSDDDLDKDEHPRHHFKHHHDHKDGQHHDHDDYEGHHGDFHHPTHHSKHVKIDLSHPGVSDHIQEIERPFAAVIDENGKILKVKVSIGEHLWSINMKKAIASFLQVPLEEGDHHTIEDEEGFYSPVKSSYVRVDRGHTSNIMVQKSHTPYQDKHRIFTYSSHKFDPVSCRTEDCHAILHDNPIKGKIIIRNKSKIIEHAEFHQTITTHPFDHAGYSFNSDISFAIHLEKEYAISSPFKLPDDIEEQSLRFSMTQHFRDPYDPSKPTKTTLFMDTEFDQDKVYQKVIKSVDYISSHLESATDENKLRLMLLGLRPDLEALDFVHLDKAYQYFDSLKKDSELEKSVFIKTLSLTRTGHATLLLYKLGTQGKITGFLGHETDISTQVGNLMYPHHRLVDKIWAYLKDYEYTKEHMKVYEDMYLSLGILASKICEMGCTRESMLLNKIVHDIIQKMKENKDHKMTKLYAMVLYNTDLPVTHDLFKEVLFDSSYDYDVRTIALWALEDEYIENPEEMRLPLIDYVYNKTLNYLFRMEVLEMILLVDNYETCYGLLMGIKEPDMRHFARSIIESQADSPHFSPRHYSMAHKLIQNIPHDDSRHTGSMMRQFNFYDERHDYGMKMNMITIASSHSIIPQRIDLEVEEIIAGRLIAPYQIHLQLHNIESLFVSDKKYSSSDKIETEDREEKFFVELEVLQDHKYVMWLHYDAEGLTDMVKEMYEEGTDSFVKKILSTFNIFQEYQMEFMTFNALGQPIEFHMKTPTFFVFKEHFSNFPEKFDFHYKSVYTNAMTVHVFNPIAHLIHGTSFVSGITIDIPVEGEFKKGKHPNLKLKFDDDTKHFLDIHSNAYNFISGAGDEVPFDAKIMPHLKELGVQINHEINHTKYEDVCEYHDKHHLFGFNVISPCEIGTSLPSLMTHLVEEYFHEHIDHNHGLGIILSGFAKINEYFHMQPDNVPINIEISHVPDVTEVNFQNFAFSYPEDKHEKRMSASMDVDIKLVDDKHLSTHLLVEYSHKTEEKSGHLQFKATNEYSGEHSEMCMMSRYNFHTVGNKFDVSKDDSAKVSFKLHFGDKCDSDSASYFTADITAKMSEKHAEHYLFALDKVTDSDIMDIHDLQIADELEHDFEHLRKMCKSDIAELHSKTHIPLTKHCYEYMYQASKLTNGHATFHYGHLPAFMVEKLDKLASLVKVFFMPYWHYDLESHDTSEKEGHLLDMHVDACTESHKLSVKIGSTEGTYRFKDIPFSAIPFDFVGSSRFSTLHKAAYDYHLTGMCDVSVRRVNIMENFIIPYNMTDCPTIISKDCSGKNRYSIKTYKISHPTYDLGLIMDFGFDHAHFEIVPASQSPNSEFKVTYTDTKTKSTKVLDEEGMLEHKIYKSENTLVFDDLLHDGLKIGYDGEFVTVLVSSYYKGDHCGVCGEYRGFMGPIVAPPKGKWSHSKQNFKEQVEYSPEVSEKWEEKCH